MKRLLIVLFVALTLLALPAQSLAFSHGPLIRVRQGTSSNWAGFAALTSLLNPQANVVNSVKGSWVVPTLTCGSTSTYSSAWVGMDGYSNSSVEQTGTEHDCSNGTSSYYAWYEMYPKPGYKVPLAVKAGDTITAEVAYNNTRGQFTLTLQNTTTGKSYSTVQRSNKAARSSAEWVVEAPWSGGVLPLANFGTLSLSNSLVNGVAVGASGLATDKIDMVSSDSSYTKASTSALTNNANFNVTWLHE
jgi:hypothetical protein